MAEGETDQLAVLEEIKDLPSKKYPDERILMNAYPPDRAIRTTRTSRADLIHLLKTGGGVAQ